MKSFWNNFSKFRENRRAVGFFKLGFWALFFGIIILVIAFSGGTSGQYPSKNDNKKAQNENKDEIKSYNFEYIYNGQKYHGTYLENEMEIVGDDVSFYLKDNEIYKSKQDGIIPNYQYLDIHNLQNKINNLEADSTTKYKDGKIEYTYIIDTLTIKYIDNLNNTFKAIISDLDNNLEINYYDINKATLNVDYEKYKYRYNEEDNYEY